MRPNQDLPHLYAINTHYQHGGATGLDSLDQPSTTPTAYLNSDLIGSSNSSSMILSNKSLALTIPASLSTQENADLGVSLLLDPETPVPIAALAASNNFFPPPSLAQTAPISSPTLTSTSVSIGLVQNAPPLSIDVGHSNNGSVVSSAVSNSQGASASETPAVFSPISKGSTWT
jgi:hypothetical protein